MDFFVLVLATFWAWETLRFAMERWASWVFISTRPLHPLLVAGFTVYFSWPDVLFGLAAAGAVGILVGLVDRFLSSPSAPAMVVPRRRGGGLPPLP
jgi:hypothetical protein